MKKAYVSFLPDWAELKKKLPLGERWPMPLLVGLASMTSLVKGPELPVLGDVSAVVSGTAPEAVSEDQERERPLWMMSPWPEAEGSRLEAARLRRMTLSGLARHRVREAVLSEPLLKAGGGLEAWRADMAKHVDNMDTATAESEAGAGGRISDGRIWNLAAAVGCLLKEPPRRILLTGSGPVLTEMAGILAPRAKLLTVCGHSARWTALELLRAKLIYDLGIVIELARRPGIEDYRQAELLLVVDGAEGAAFLGQGMAAMTPGALVWDLTPDGALAAKARLRHPRLNVRRLVWASRDPDF
ncbi:MAG: hypothetical protein LBL26_07995, partial [Peptococcaceae bacterium]|nr:hypothetical protein [Peptococcaceae bacterium]